MKKIRMKEKEMLEIQARNETLFIRYEKGKFGFSFKNKIRRKKK